MVPARGEPARHRTGDTDLGDELLPALRAVVDATWPAPGTGSASTRPTGCSPRAPPGTALTWMDARVYGVPVTRAPASRSRSTRCGSTGWRARRAGRAGRSGRGRAWRRHGRRPPRSGSVPPPRRRLHDVGRARAGVPLGGPPCTTTTAPPQPAAGLVAAVRAAGAGRRRRCAGSRPGCSPRSGLRSLAPDSPGFVGRHRAARPSGTAGYHQGTVWPWLLGPYVDAPRGRQDRPSTRYSSGIESHLTEYGLGSVSETADGLPPHAATGCPFQAWSVAELLRVRRKSRSALHSRQRSVVARYRDPGRIGPDPDATPASTTGAVGARAPGTNSREAGRMSPTPT